MIVAAIGPDQRRPATAVARLAEQGEIGGIVVLGRVPQPGRAIEICQVASRATNQLPLLVSMDAEPGLAASRMGIKTSLSDQSASSLKSIDQVKASARNIGDHLHQLGVHHNYAPVCDLAANVAIRSRSFGSTQSEVEPRMLAFLEETQAMGLVATAKHFPGHGTVKGDSHKKLVFLDAMPPELPIFKDAIEAGVLSVMVGHIEMRTQNVYNTQGRPASLSPEIIQDLLKKTLNFKGIVITDALDMGALSQFPDADLLAAKAGSDIILMPADPGKLIGQIQTEIQRDPTFARQIEASIKKVLRLKICAGLFVSKPMT
ncbi:MAG: glycoside hydrolase family 3 N-terminal domain-containing protein [Bacteroidota bacterium]